MLESLSGSLNSFGSAFTPAGTLPWKDLVDKYGGFGSFGDYSSFGSSATSGGGGMLGGFGGLALAGGLGIGQGLIGLFGQQNQASAARSQARKQAKQAQKLLNLQFDRMGQLEGKRFEYGLATDAFGYGLERMAALDSSRIKNSPDYLQATGREVGANIAGRFMDPTYAARTAQMFYG